MTHDSYCFIVPGARIERRGDDSGESEVGTGVVERDSVDRVDRRPAPATVTRIEDRFGHGLGE